MQVRMISFLSLWTATNQSILPGKPGKSENKGTKKDGSIKQQVFYFNLIVIYTCVLTLWHKRWSSENPEYGDTRGDKTSTPLLMAWLLLLPVEPNPCKRADVISSIAALKLPVPILLSTVEPGKLSVNCLSVKVSPSPILWLLTRFSCAKEDPRTPELREFPVKRLLKVDPKDGGIWLVSWNEFRKPEGAIGLFPKLPVGVNPLISVPPKLVLKIYIEI